MASERRRVITDVHADIADRRADLPSSKMARFSADHMIHRSVHRGRWTASALPGLGQ